MNDENVNDINDLAKILGLSVTTISRVLNGKAELYRISQKTKQRVLMAAAKHNYLPNQLARSLKLKKTDTLGLIIPDISNPFFADIARSIENEARDSGYSLILCDSKNEISLENNLISLLRSHKVAGIIIAPVGIESKHIVKTYETGTALVIIDRYFPDIELPTIHSDNFQGSFDATNYIISMGHRNIACIQGVSTTTNNERIKGYITALNENNISLNENFILGKDFSIENGFRNAMILLKYKKPPTAIFALNNLICLGVIKATMELGLEIPEDISVVTFDDQPYSPFLRTPMTAIHQEIHEIGKIAVDVLLKQIKDIDYIRENPFYLKLKTRLVIRDSVKNIKNL